MARFVRAAKADCLFGAEVSKPVRQRDYAERLFFRRKIPAETGAERVRSPASETHVGAVDRKFVAVRNELRRTKVSHDPQKTELKMRFNGWTAIAVIIGLAGCGSSDQVTDASPTDAAATAVATEATVMPAVANLQTAAGAPAGTATATAGQGTILLSLRVEGLPPGEHGVHIHTVGKCEAPSFESAGSHWNPAEKQHGLDNPQGQHAGDMPNLTVGADGRGMLSYRLKGGSIEGLLDEDGSAMVVHAKVDDQKTDPSGDSGDRIACGVFSAG